MSNKKQGFTLVELLVVIAIIGLLSTLSIVALNSARARSRDARRVADVKQIQTALEMYFNDAASYPAAVASGTSIAYDTGIGTTTYMQVVPTPPTPDDGCTGSVEYSYTQTGSGASYTLEYCLGADTSGISAALNTATPAGIH